jgi:hypothetical protein
VELNRYALPCTASRTRRDKSDEQSAQAREAMQGALNEAKDRAQQVLSEVQEEASQQGLTVEAAKEAASSVAGKFGTWPVARQRSRQKTFHASTGSFAS